PSTTIERLVEGLRAQGIGFRDLRHIVLTHIHLDHAGASGHMAALFPEATVYVHEDGAPHLVDPTRLVASTRRTFGDAHDRLWGETRAVPADRIRTWTAGDPGPRPYLRALSTPGHIAHHLAYLDERDGTLYSGDSLGIVLADGAPTHPATPPPAVDLRAWEGTLEEIRAVAPERFGAAHFGFHDDPVGRAAELASALEALERRVRDAMSRDDMDDAFRFNSEVMARLAPYVGEERVAAYYGTFPAVKDWEGVKFYLERNTR
ncbi:MAG: MBL fold metallo-hydrolase, partial [Gemmatimonadota bacterium]|nr:MBL fold metallo-hydrolase [Gemmatimonadota bacterium]